MLKALAKKSAYYLTPRWAGWAKEQVDVRRQIKEAKLLRARLGSCGSVEAAVDEVLGSAAFGAVQKRGEIVALLSLLSETQPACLCEIGGQRGGTLALFSHVAARDARILSIDLNYGRIEIAAYPHLARSTQRLTCLGADSHSPQTVKAVTDWLGDRQFDFLFIDGDHSFSGVKNDHEVYAPFVRRGGMIVLHDIEPDFKTRFGIITRNDVGGVPAFWKEVKERSPRTSELIEDVNQDGYGIGVIWSNGRPSA
jgi:predicted O-methyltransferase YrrM